jgi:hypothetical protein
MDKEHEDELSELKSLQNMYRTMAATYLKEKNTP